MISSPPLWIKWKGIDDADGKPFWLDCLPENAFADTGEPRFSHEMQCPRTGKRVTVLCRREVLRSKATLEYTPAEDDEYYEGKTIIHFVNSQRKQVWRVDWFADGKLMHNAATALTLLNPPVRFYEDLVA